MGLQDHLLEDPKAVKIVDCHAHTIHYSTDGVQTLEELLADASSKGLAGICLTDHYDKDICYDGIEHIFDLATYFKHLEKTIALLPSEGLKLFKGIELGWMPHLTPLFNEIIADYPLDSVILSLHCMDNDKDIYVDRSIYDNGVQDCFRRALRQSVEMMQCCPDFTILAHFDYVSRYVPGGPVQMEYRTLSDEFDALFRHLIQEGKSFELNTRSVLKFRQAVHSPENAWPDPAIFRRYLELGGRLVSLSSDTHQFGEAATLFPEALDYLRQVGVRELTHFEAMQPILTPID
jgi:histidinol-phosphatase (PHP family)